MATNTNHIPPGPHRPLVTRNVRIRVSPGMANPARPTTQTRKTRQPATSSSARVRLPAVRNQTTSRNSRGATMKLIGVEHKPFILHNRFVGSWLPYAHDGNRFTTNRQEREAAWASWAVDNLVWVESKKRDYPALRLPEARFYEETNPSNKPYKTTPPHVELTTPNTPNPLFGAQLAMAGNGLAFPWWMYSEVTALKRVLNFTPHTDTWNTVSELLWNNRTGLVAALNTVRNFAEPLWDEIVECMSTDPEKLTNTVCSPFTPTQVTAALPDNPGLSVNYEKRLFDRNKKWSARRVGIWQINTPDQKLKIGVVVPRLTQTSTFLDPLFDPATESPAALLVRVLILQRVCRTHFDWNPPTPRKNRVTKPGRKPHFAGLPSKPGGKPTEASQETVQKMLTDHTTPPQLWDMLETWTQNRGYVLGVKKETWLKTAYQIRAGAPPTRRTANTLLPVVWDPARKRSLRVIYRSGTPTK